MRTQLAKKNNERSIFTGVFVRFGVKNGWYTTEKTVLLRDIKNSSGEMVSDHLWFNLTKSFQKLKLNENDVVRFEARVKKYMKGYQGNKYYNIMEFDYKLSYPTKLEIINKQKNKKEV